jgi:hypothetical protein
MVDSDWQRRPKTSPRIVPRYTLLFHPPSIFVDGENVVPHVYTVLDKMQTSRTRPQHGPGREATLRS